MPRKIKVTRHKVTEPDEFISTSSIIFDYVKNNYVTIGSAAAVVLVVALITFGWYYYSKGQERDALNIFNKAKQLYQQSTATPADGKPQADFYRPAIEQFEEVATNYSGTSAAATSILYMGDCYYHLKDYDKAIDNYTRFISTSRKNDYLRQFAFEGLGYCHEEKGDYEKALDYFKQSLNERNCAIKNLLYLDMARCYEALKDNTAALEYYTKAGGDASNSLFFELAQERANSLKN